ncbi:MAG: T9SS type A sorting domain-containing protein [Ginsengibacter sp.]
MEKKFTLFTRTFMLVCSCILTSSFFATTFAQVACPNSLSLFTEDFGSGTTTVSSADVVSATLTYQQKEPLTIDGFYRVVYRSFQNFGWHKSSDHTGNTNGRMLVSNGQAGMFYSHTVTRSAGFLPGDFSASLYAMNLSIPGTCTSPIFPVFTYTFEYVDAGGNWVPLAGSYTAAPLPETATPAWVAQGAIFTLPATGAFVVTTLRLTISDETGSGCGNDFAIDDINISQCPEGGVTPVTFLKIGARQRGSGIAIDFSTSQELNSDHFDIEKSVDGNSNWVTVSSLKGTGNSSVLRSYSAYDAKPFYGTNFYRIKQVDKDGKFKYSSTVNVKINASKTGVTVLANPFHNNLTVDFLSSKNEVINVRLVDIAGKQVAKESWTINSGSTRKDLSNVSALQQGMYILSVTNASGEILYNGKVLKQ